NADHLPGVRLVEAAAPAQLEDAALAERRLFEEVGVVRSRQIIDGKPLAQAPFADGHLAQVELFHERLEDGGAGNDYVGPLGIDPRNFTASIEWQRAKMLDDFPQTVAGEYVPLGKGALVEAAHGDFGQVDDRSRAADRLFDRELPQALERAHRPGADVTLDAGVLRRRNRLGIVRPKEHARQTDRAELQ